MVKALCIMAGIFMIAVYTIVIIDYYCKKKDDREFNVRKKK